MRTGTGSHRPGGGMQLYYSLHWGGGGGGGEGMQLYYSLHLVLA